LEAVKRQPGSDDFCVISFAVFFSSARNLAAFSHSSLLQIWQRPASAQSLQESFLVEQVSRSWNGFGPRIAFVVSTRFEGAGDFCLGRVCVVSGARVRVVVSLARGAGAGT